MRVNPTPKPPPSQKHLDRAKALGRYTQMIDRMMSKVDVWRKDVYQCRKCGSLVIDRELHRRFHKELEAGPVMENQRQEKMYETLTFLFGGQNE